MSTSAPMSLRTIVLLVAVSAPLALGFETAIRLGVIMPMMGAEFAEVRAYFWPEFTPAVRIALTTRIAWILAGVSVVAGLLGVALLRRPSWRSLAWAREQPDPAAAARAKVRDQMLLLTSIPQIPAILATLCFSFGAAWVPVVTCMVVSTAFVLGMGQLGEHMLVAHGPDKRATAASNPISSLPDTPARR